MPIQRTLSFILEPAEVVQPPKFSFKDLQDAALNAVKLD